MNTPTETRRLRRRNDNGYGPVEIAVGLIVLTLLTAIGVGLFQWINRAESAVTNSATVSLATLVQAEAQRSNPVGVDQPVAATWGQEAGKTGVYGWPDGTTVDLQADSFWIQEIGANTTAPKASMAGTPASGTVAAVPASAPVATWAQDNNAYRLLVTGGDASDWRCALIVSNLGNKVTNTSGGTPNTHALDSTGPNLVAGFRGRWYQSSTAPNTPADPLYACDPVSLGAPNSNACPTSARLANNTAPSVDRATSTRAASCLTLNTENRWQVNADHIFSRNL